MQSSYRNAVSLDDKGPPPQTNSTHSEKDDVRKPGTYRNEEPQGKRTSYLNKKDVHAFSVGYVVPLTEEQKIQFAHEYKRGEA